MFLICLERPIGIDSSHGIPRSCTGCGTDPCQGSQQNRLRASKCEPGSRCDLRRRLPLWKRRRCRAPRRHAGSLLFAASVIKGMAADVGQPSLVTGTSLWLWTGPGSHASTCLEGVGVQLGNDNVQGNVFTGMVHLGLLCLALPCLGLHWSVALVVVGLRDRGFCDQLLALCFCWFSLHVPCLKYMHSCLKLPLPCPFPIVSGSPVFALLR